MNSFVEFIAHVKQDENGKWAPHLLEDHLRDVAEMAKEFAEVFHAGGWAELAGLWHDLGKYSWEFQAMIRKKSGYDAHLEDQPGKVNHSSAGALHACQGLKGDGGKILAYLIAGHHAGLADWHDGLKERLNITKPENYAHYHKACQANIPSEILNPVEQISTLKLPEKVINLSECKIAVSFWIRMLFSCLVDSDFLDTEAFMDPEKALWRDYYPKLEEIRPVFEYFMKQKTNNIVPTEINQLRTEILTHVLNKATAASGIYTLTVPTGGGKTLTSIAYALAHANHHGHQRIIYVLPYTSILEQTAQVLREALKDLGRECLIEHHSMLDENNLSPTEKETSANRLAAENWNAPIILTTNVQFFESLFANRTSRCRKLHNICNSIIILDEIQQMPPAFKKPIEEVLHLLAKAYGATIILCTATQPALDLPIIGELAPDPEKLFERMKRVEVRFPKNLNEPQTWETLADTLSQEEQVLCIVNRRADAQTLWSLMPEGTLHLSGLMCPAHRSEVIKEIKTRLEKGETLRVISTQVVEAGVDIDFPVVYRALAGLDSIAQAAGRCNREGKRIQPGLVHVFVPPVAVLPGTVKIAEGVTRNILLEMDGAERIELTPDIFTTFFRLFYADQKQDKADIISLLKQEGKDPHFSFKEAAEKFTIINEGQQAICIPYNDYAKRLLAELRAVGPSKERLRKLQPYSVNLYQEDFNKLLLRKDVMLAGESKVYTLSYERLYDKTLGLNLNYSPSVSELIV